MSEKDCSSPGCCSGVDRREFLKLASWGAAASALGAVGGPAMAGPFMRPGPGVEHFVPADKKLSAEWVRGLHERGGARAFRGKELDTIGMPVGGIGAGQLYLRGDGTLGAWQVFNRHHFSGYGATNYQYRPYNEIECGDHYARALASWGAFLALSGYDYHGPKGRLAFAPRMTPEDFRSAFTAAEGWGVYAQKRAAGVQGHSIEVLRGRLRLRTLAFEPPGGEPPGGRSPGRVRVRVGEGDPHEAAFAFRDGRVEIDLGREITLREGESLGVDLG